MSNNGTSSSGGDWVASGASNGGTISPLELESLTKLDEHSHKHKPAALSATGLPSRTFDKLILLLKLYFELYPRLMCGGAGCLLTVLLVWWSPWSSLVGKKYNRNYMTTDYSAMEDNFNFQTANIDHWCLFGGDDKCYCEDPTEGISRSEEKGWAVAHNRNKALVDQALAAGDGVDVVFLGDQTVQAWDGPAPVGPNVATYFNQTFNSPKSAVRGLALGISGDRLNNILWRIQHGEMPPALSPKVFWLIAGTNDLAVGMCSESVVTLGIMRVAEEIHHHYPGSVVVIQGILPRTHHKDGALEGAHMKYHRPSSSNSRTPGQKHHGLFHKAGGGGGGGGLGFGGDPLNPYGIPGSRGGGGGERNLLADHELDSDNEMENNDASKNSNNRDLGETHATDSAAESSIRQGLTWADSRRSQQPRFDYYLWPSIKAINKELEDFCSKHKHFVYFDADDLVLGSIGNERYKAPHKAIITELMPDYVNLSYLGHRVVIDALNDELQRIIMDDDESNDIETQTGSKKSSSSTSSGGSPKKKIGGGKQ